MPAKTLKTVSLTPKERAIAMENMTLKDKDFPTWAKNTYATKKEAVDFLENSSDPFEKAIGTLIKKYAGGGND